MASADQNYIDALQSGANPNAALSQYTNAYTSMGGRIVAAGRPPNDLGSTAYSYGSDPNRARVDQDRQSPQSVVPLVNQALGSDTFKFLTANTVMIVLGTSFVIMGGWFAFKSSEAQAIKQFK